MKKNEFIEKLRAGLCGLPEEDIHRSVEFYSEIIDDKMEDGLSEEEAVAEIGDTESIVSQIVAEIPLAKLVKGKIKPKRTLKVWEIVLLALGSPIWLSLLIAAAAVIFSAYVTLWSVIVVLWSVLAVTVSVSLGGIFGIAPYKTWEFLTYFLLSLDAVSINSSTVSMAAFNLLVSIASTYSCRCANT